MLFNLKPELGPYPNPTWKTRPVLQLCCYQIQIYDPQNANASTCSFILLQWGKKLWPSRFSWSNDYCWQHKTPALITAQFLEVKGILFGHENSCFCIKTKKICHQLRDLRPHISWLCLIAVSYTVALVSYAIPCCSIQYNRCCIACRYLPKLHSICSIY